MSVSYESSRNMPNADGHQFINSVLANIAGSSPLTPLVTPGSGNSVKRDANQSSNGLASVPLKRKAEQQDGQSNAAKVLKRDSKAVTTPSFNVPTSPMSVRKDPSTSRPSPASPNPVSAPPRKGTFADILARAQVAQAANKPVGVIKHKPVGKISIQERRALREQIKAKKSVGKSARSAGTAVDPRKKSPAVDVNGQASRSVPSGTIRDKGKARSGDSESTYKGTSRPARVETDYKGTARPVKAETDYKGTARQPDGHSPISPGRRNGLQRNPSALTKRQAPNRYGVREEIEDDDEDEERYGEDEEEDQYDSEASSDMEAAAFEVEEEEFSSLKKAKKEDEEALRQEMELKRKKLERKRALQALASKRRA